MTIPFRCWVRHAGPEGTFRRALHPRRRTAPKRMISRGTQPGHADTRTDARGLFEGFVTGAPQPLKYQAQGNGAEWWVTDPYSFGPVLGPVDDFLMAEGTHLRLYDKMGAHLIDHEGADGVHFAVWAPNARRVSVVGDFNDWDGRRHVMRRRSDIGVWEIFLPDIGGAPRLQIRDHRRGRHAAAAERPIPSPFDAELRPKTASLTTAPPCA